MSLLNSLTPVLKVWNCTVSTTFNHLLAMRAPLDRTSQTSATVSVPARLLSDNWDETLIEHCKYTHTDVSHRSNAVGLQPRTSRWPFTIRFFPALLIFLAFPMRFCLGPVCSFTLMEERRKCSVCPNSPGRTLVVPRFVGCSNLQADLPLTCPQRKVVKRY